MLSPSNSRNLARPAASQIARFRATEEGWIESVAGILDVMRLDRSSTDEIAEINLWFAAECEFVFSYDEACTWKRSKWQASRCDEYVFVHRYLDCTLTGQSGTEDIAMAPGRIYLEDQGALLNTIKSQGWCQGIIMPKQLLGYRTGEHSTNIDLSANPALSQAMNFEFNHLFKSLYLENAIELDVLNRIIACIKVAIGSEFQDGDVRRKARDSLTTIIRRHIECRLASPELTAESLLEQFGVSRASLYRMFEAYGGVRQYVNNRRIFHAVRELADQTAIRGGVSAVAEKWNFSSAASFNRAVRRTLGTTPGRILETPPSSSCSNIRDLPDSTLLHTPIAV